MEENHIRWRTRTKALQLLERTVLAEETHESKNPKTRLFLAFGVKIMMPVWLEEREPGGQ